MSSRKLTHCFVVGVGAIIFSATPTVGIAQDNGTNPFNITPSPIPLESGTILIATAEDGKLWILDTQTWERTLYLDLNGSGLGIYFPSFNKKEHLIAYTIHRNDAEILDTLLFVDFITGEQRTVLETLHGHITDINPYPDGSRIAVEYFPPDQLPITRSSIGKVCVLDRQNGNCDDLDPDPGSMFSTRNIGWIDDERFITLGDIVLFLFNVHTLEYQQLLPEIINLGGATPIPDSNQLLVYGELHDRDGVSFPYDVFIFDLNTMEITELPYDTQPYLGQGYLFLSPDERYLAYVGAVPGVQTRTTLTNFTTGEVIADIDNLSGAIEWLPDSRNFLATTFDGENYQAVVRIDAQTGAVHELFPTTSWAMFLVVP